MEGLRYGVLPPGLLKACLNRSLRPSYNANERAFVRRPPSQRERQRPGAPALCMMQRMRSEVQSRRLAAIGDGLSRPSLLPFSELQ